MSLSSSVFLDIAKKQDKYKLNELWSIYHKLQKIDTDQTKWQEKLEKTINTGSITYYQLTIFPFSLELKNICHLGLFGEFDNIYLENDQNLCLG
jgi:hypothetical protein